jgi:hypothetical protein
MVDREQIAGLMAYVKNHPAVKTVGYLAETTGYGQGGLTSRRSETCTAWSRRASRSSR